MIFAAIISTASFGGRGNSIWGAFIVAAIGLTISSFLMAGRWKFSLGSLTAGFVMAIFVAYLLIGYFSGSWSLNSVNIDWLLAVFLGTGIPWIIGCAAGLAFPSKRRES
jgi:hypothetical protein